MRKVLMLVLAVVAGMLLLAGPSKAEVAGTSEKETTTTDESGNETTTYENTVDCGEGLTGDPTSGVAVVAGEGGPEGGSLVVCSDDDALVDGRVIASGGTSGGYVAADGDDSNPEQGRGFARVNLNGSPSVQCDDPTDPQTAAENAGPADDQSDCG